MKTDSSDYAQCAQQLVQSVAVRSSSQIITGTPRLEGAEARPVHLTPRELQVLALLCEGLPNKLISRRLEISSATVKCHISRILSELGVSSRLQAVVAAARHGLLPESGSVIVSPDETPPLKGTPGTGLHGSPMPAYLSAGPA